jgi:PAS domain S-box-containing protein
MKLKPKLILCFSAVSLLIAVVGVVGIHSARTINHSFDLITDGTAPALHVLGRIKAAGLDMNAAAMSYSLIASEVEHLVPGEAFAEEEEEEEEEELEKSKLEMAKWIAKFKNIAQHDEELLFIKKIETAGASIYETGRQLIELKKMGVMGREVLEKKRELLDSRKRFKEIIDNAIAVMFDELEEEDAAADQVSANALIFNLAAIPFGILLAGLFGFGAAEVITRPIIKLKEVSAAIGRGEFGKLTDIRSRDEIGDLAQSIDTMAVDLATHIAKERQFAATANATAEAEKKKTLELEAAHEYTSNIIKSMIQSLIVLTPYGTIKSVNKAALDLLGYTEKELIGMPSDGIFEDTFEETTTPFKAVRMKKILMEEGVLRDYEMRYKTKTGERIPVSLSGSVMRDATGRSQAIMLSAWDLRDTLSLRSKLVTFEKMSAVGTLVAGTAHELNNPMTGIVNYIQYCLKHTAQDDKRFTVLKDAEAALLRCVDIVSNLLTFSHADQNKVSDFQEEECRVLWDRVLKLLNYRIERDKITLKRNDAPKTPSVWMNSNRMQQVFLNLAVNALDALEESQKKELTIEVGPHEKGVRVTVADTGCGISPKQIRHIFDPFFTTKAPGKGTGLGLSISQGIIQEHGGVFSCDSRPGEGTRFTILLPKDIRKQKN